MEAQNRLGGLLQELCGKRHYSSVTLNTAEVL